MSKITVDIFNKFGNRGGKKKTRGFIRILIETTFPLEGLNTVEGEYLKRQLESYIKQALLICYGAKAKVTIEETKVSASEPELPL